MPHLSDAIPIRSLGRAWGMRFSTIRWTHLGENRNKTMHKVQDDEVEKNWCRFFCIILGPIPLHWLGWFMFCLVSIHSPQGPRYCHISSFVAFFIFKFNSSFLMFNLVTSAMRPTTNLICRYLLCHWTNPFVMSLQILARFLFGHLTNLPT